MHLEKEHGSFFHITQRYRTVLSDSRYMVEFSLIYQTI